MEIEELTSEIAKWIECLKILRAEKYRKIFNIHSEFISTSHFRLKSFQLKQSETRGWVLVRHEKAVVSWLNFKRLTIVTSFKM